MKKLALALVCLVGVAFFASCNKTVENPEPTISIYEEEGFVKDGDVVDLNTEIQFGFVMASNAETEKELKSLTVKIGEAQETIDLTGLTEYTYKDAITFTLEAKDIVAEGVIEATVTDEDGETATATITLSLNEVAQLLVAKDITWVRRGATCQNTEEMAENGLYWYDNHKDIMATIKPVEGATMYLCNGDDFATLTTDVEKAAYFANLQETARPADEYRGVSATLGTQTPNDLLAVIDANGNQHLVLFSTAKAETITGVGTQVTINGQVK